MVRIGSVTLFTGICLALFASAQDGPAPKKVPLDAIKEVPGKGADDDIPKKDLPEILVPRKDVAKDPDAKEETPKEIIERLHKNMEMANVRLKDQSDPTEPTRKVMKDIIADLDKLIKQQKDNQDC